MTLPKQYVPHTPTVRQSAFLLLDEREAFFGGAAGGGKSDALLMGALQYAERPDYAGLILRKSYTDLALPGAIMDRAHQWLSGTDAIWNERDHRYTFPRGFVSGPAFTGPVGGVLQFGYLERARDRYRYQSAEFQYVAFDELTQFAKDEYEYLHTRMRRLAGSDLPIRMRSASNPGGFGHEWVKQHFIPLRQTDPLTGEVTTIYPHDPTGHVRPYVPSSLKDNPFIDQAEYIASLWLIDPTLRAQMLAGDWAAVKPGSVFKREWFKVVDVAPRMVKRAIYSDLASTEDDGHNDPDWTAITWGGMTPGGQLVIEGVARARYTPAKVEELHISTYNRLNPERPGAYSGWVEQEPGSAGASVVSNFQRRVLPGYTVRGHRPTGDKYTRSGLLASMAERGDVLLVRGPWIEEWLDEVVAFDEIDPAAHDDQVDSAVGLSIVLFRPTDATSRSYIEEARQRVIRKGDLVLRGERYIDQPVTSSRRR